MSNEQQIEKEIQEKGLNAPRLCPDDIDAAIVSESYTVLPSGKAMVCELILRNGFSVRGESACVSKANFNEEVGRKIAREDARDKVWLLEGYLLQERLFGASRRRSFSEALDAVKLGKAIKRSGWNGIGLKVRAQFPDENSKMTLPYLYIEYPRDAAAYPGARCPWLASQTDIMACDWEIIE